MLLGEKIQPKIPHLFQKTSVCIENNLVFLLLRVAYGKAGRQQRRSNDAADEYVLVSYPKITIRSFGFRP